MQSPSRGSVRTSACGDPRSPGDAASEALPSDPGDEAVSHATLLVASLEDEPKGLIGFNFLLSFNSPVSPFEMEK